MPDPSPDNRMAALTSLRFFAAFYVLIFHTFPRSSTLADDASVWVQMWERFCGRGIVAVSAFPTRSRRPLTTDA